MVEEHSRGPHCGRHPDEVVPIMEDRIEGVPRNGGLAEDDLGEVGLRVGSPIAHRMEGRDPKGNKDTDDGDDEEGLNGAPAVAAGKVGGDHDARARLSVAALMEGC